MKKIQVAIFAILLYGNMLGQNNPASNSTGRQYRLIVLDPGHFHAALLQKKMYDNVAPEVHVYAPAGAELDAYLALIDKYNTRSESPTHWQEKVYKGDDFVEKMVTDKAGDMVVIAGNNKRKSQYIDKAIDAGINVLADKPMIIEPQQFEKLVNTFANARKKNVVLFDVMTERYDFTNVLQKELMANEQVFGTLQKGTADDPAISEKSTHYYLKTVSGSPLIRPAWFYDIHQQGEGLADITTHMVDIIEWKCFNNRQLNYKKDIQVATATSWPTAVTPSQFFQSTNLRSYPDYLSYAVKDSTLNVYSNGEINYKIAGVHARVFVDWQVEAEPGSGDSHFSIVKGTKANLVIRQDAKTKFQPVLFIEPVVSDRTTYEQQLQTIFTSEIEKKYPGVKIAKAENGWQVVLPDQYMIGHEQQFAMVAGQFMKYLDAGALPQQEIDYMLAKYYTISEALKKAKRKN